MLASGARRDAQQRIGVLQTPESALHPEFGLRRRAVGSDAILARHAAVLVAAEGPIDQALVNANMAMHDGQILLVHVAGFPESAQFAGGLVLFRDQHHAAGFAVEPVDQMRSDRVTEMEANTTDQTGIHVTLGWMTNQPCRFVDHQQFSILMDDFKQWFH